MFGEDRHKTDLKHECELTINDDVTYRFIDHGLCVNLRRWFRKRMLIDESNPRVRSFYKSSFIITREKIFHLNYHYYMIHPFSTFRELWELVQALAIVVQLTLTATLIFLESTTAEIFGVITDLFTFFDIVLSFNTGYVHKSANCIVMNRRLVAKRYLLTTFILDVASFINLYYVYKISGKDYHNRELDPNYNKYLEFIQIVKWLRYIVFWIYLNRLKESRQLNMLFMGVIRVVLSVFLLVLWMTALSCIVTFDARDIDSFTKRNFVVNAHEVFCMLFLFGTTEHPNDMGILITQAMCLLVGFILTLVLLCHMMQSGAKYNSSRKYNQSVKQLSDYMRHKSLPPALQSKILRYYDFRYETSYYQEDHIMKILGPQLQQEVMLQAHMHFFSKFPLFEIIPLHVLFGIIMKMKVMCCMPSDSIIAPGTRNTSMFFINYGSVAIYTISGIELRHLAEGEHFGELALMGDRRYTSETIVAIDCCEIYVLKRKHFMNEIEAYPDVNVKVVKYMSDFLAKHYYEDAEMYEAVKT